MKFLIRTYGCQMNVRDSESVAALLLQHGCTQAPDEESADLILVNSCSVRGKAEAKALGKLGLLVAGKRDFPGRIVGATGCMVQRLQQRLFAKVPGLDFAVGTQRLNALPEILERVVAGRGPVLDVAESEQQGDGLAGHVNAGATAFVNILFGCDRFCTYCIVPHVRGRERSREGADVLEEVRRLAAAGVREVTLLGQSVMSYGRRNAVWPEGHISPRGFLEPLPRLLEAVAAVEGIQRVRFTSGHPLGCSDELARAMGEIPAVCEHLHLPLQSGSDRILGLMRRGYTAAEYLAAVQRLRAAVPSLALTTDLIVGFPTETEEECAETARLCEEIGFDNAFIFKYSPRPGTAAAEWDDDVATDAKIERNKRLLAEQDDRALRINAGLVGSSLEVLVEGESLREATRWSGRTRTNKIVIFAPPQGVKPGDLVAIRIERARAQALYGAVEGRNV
jgi:tRNA-2-methylthio-N6-dimethylallyladenosine synthase